MNVKRSLLVGATIATIILGGGGLAIAASNTTSTQGDTLVDRIASKFNLNQSDVQSVVDQFHTDREAQREANFKDRLAQAVKDGKLTQAQADHITSVLQEINTLRGSKAPDQLDQTTRDQIKQKMDDLRTWAKDNNVDMRYVMGGHSRGFGHHGHGLATDDAPSDSDSNTQTN